MGEQEDRWKNRRLMAWFSMMAGLFFPILHLATDMSSIAIPFYTFVTGNVMIYIGFATLDHKWQKQDEQA